MGIGKRDCYVCKKHASLDNIHCLQGDMILNTDV